MKNRMKRLKSLTSLCYDYLSHRRKNKSILDDGRNLPNQLTFYIIDKVIAAVT